MKHHSNARPGSHSPAAAERKNHSSRIGVKTLSYRYERRKLREQLRHLDWALPDDE